MVSIDVIEVRVIPWANGCSYGDAAVFEVYTDDRRDLGESKARQRAKPFCVPGFAVIVRPKYNDVLLTFHEWRSFDGGDFEYVEWNAG